MAGEWHLDECDAVDVPAQGPLLHCRKTMT